MAFDRKLTLLILRSAVQQLQKKALDQLLMLLRLGDSHTARLPLRHKRAVGDLRGTLHHPGQLAIFSEDWLEPDGADLALSRGGVVPSLGTTLQFSQT